MKPCKHGHVDGVLHTPCYQCKSEYLEAEIETLSHQLSMLSQISVVRERDEWKRRCQSVLSIWKDHYPLTELWKRHGDASNWFEEE